jgi:eukaryotic-like serine/threonine-protein kinase
MQQSTKSDHLLMSLVERVLARPKNDRQVYLQNECGNDTHLFSQAWTYVQAEERMGSFLLDPLVSPDECDPPLQPGQLLLDRFRIIREVARGGMGIVWEAMDEKMDLRVALKCAKAGFGKQLPPEVRNARDISHPNVCNIFEIHTVRGPRGEFDFISMEFLEGETLSERLRRAPFSKQESLKIAQQLCAGLGEAHRNNVVHGDLKSNNIILTTEANGSVQAVIMDFGLARRQTNPGQLLPTEVLAGTPAYMAPELWRGVKPSAASDIYALGVVLWELVSGRRPGDVGTASTLPLSQRDAWKLPAWHGRWHRLIARCLEEDPAKRFQNADEVARALGPPRTRRWLLTAAAAAFLTIASGVVSYQRATAQAVTVRLALLPFVSSDGGSIVSQKIFRETADKLARLKSSTHTKFIFIPLDKVLRNRVDTPEKARTVLGATHVLQGELDKQTGTIGLRVNLTNSEEWDANYKTDETSYLPTALAGVVTESLHLPITETPTVSAAALTNYVAGLTALRHDSSVDAALSFLEQAVGADHSSPLTYAGLAEAQWLKYAATSNKVWLNRTIESVTQAEKRNPDLSQVHVIAGLLKANAGRYERAAAEYLRAIELEPANGDAYRRLGETYRRNSQPGEALASFRKAIEVDPRQYRNFQNLGSFYYFQRADYEEAVKYFRTAVALAPNEPAVHYALGAAELDLGQFEAAEYEFRKSIRLHEEPRSLHALGHVLMYEQKDRQAIPFIERALLVGPARCSWWISLGTAYRRIGRKADAKAAYSRGLDLAEVEMNKNTRDSLVRARLAYLCARLGDRRRGQSEITQALQQTPDTDTLWMAVNTYEALDRRDDALSVLAASPAGVLSDVSRWPDLADLGKDSRFLKLLASHSKK